MPVRVIGERCAQACDEGATLQRFRQQRFVRRIRRGALHDFGERVLEIGEECAFRDRGRSEGIHLRAGGREQSLAVANVGSRVGRVGNACSRDALEKWPGFGELTVNCVNVARAAHATIPDDERRRR